MRKHSEYDEIPVIYNPSNMSLRIVTIDNCLYDLDDMEAMPSEFDVCLITEYVALYRERFGHSPLANEPEYLRDLRESYEEDTLAAYNMREIYDLGMTIRQPRRKTTVNNEVDDDE